MTGQPTAIFGADDRVQAVLATYHEMIERERGERGSRPQGDRHHMQDPTQRDPLLRAVGPETGRFINILARSLERPTILELGTSYGYSGIWLAEAARASCGRLVTMEQHGYKSDFAKEMAAKAGLAEFVEFCVGDAVQMIANLPTGIDFVLVDLWKDLYVPCLEAFLPKLSPGAIIVADNMIRPGNEEVKRYAQTVRSKPGISSVLLPIGSGIEVSRYDPGRRL